MKDDLISRQAAIDVVDKWFERIGLNGDICVDGLRSLPSAQPNDIADVGKMVKQPEQRWIPCKDKLPEEDYWSGANHQYSADVLMTIYNAEDEETIIDYGHTVDGKWYSDTTDCPVPPWWEVLAWMPLLEPYTPEGGKE